MTPRLIVARCACNAVVVSDRPRSEKWHCRRCRATQERLAVHRERFFAQVPCHVTIAIEEEAAA